MNEEIANTDSNPQGQELTAAEQSWLSSLPEEMRSAPSLGKFKDVGALAQSYLEAEKALAGRVALPKEGSSPEEWAKFYAKLGMPENGFYLEQRAPEDEEYIKAYEQMFQAQGLSKKQGMGLFESLYKFSNDLQEKQKAKLENARSANLEWLKKNYDSEFDSKMTLMQAALTKYGSKELAGLVEEIGYDPALVDMLVKAGGSLKSDSLITGGSAAVPTTQKAAVAEIKRLEGDSDFMVKFRDKNHPEHEASVRQREELYKLAYDS